MTLSPTSLPSSTQILIPATEPTAFPTSSEPQPICIKGEVSNDFIDYNGKYELHSFDDTLNLPIWYKSDINKYIYPIFRTGGYYWQISSSLGSIICFAFARLFDIEDTNGEWTVWSGSEWVNEPEMMITDCSLVLL